MTAEHRLKCWPNYWDAIERGDKTFEVRRDDRGFQRGDIVLLQKWDNKAQCYEMEYSKASCIGMGDVKTLKRQISYVLTGGQFGIEPGYVVLALAIPAAQP